MNRPRIEQELTQIEQDVARGEKNIARQREIITELRRGGHDITRAMQLLVTFEETQRLHVADRERLQQELWSAR